MKHLTFLSCALALFFTIHVNAETLHCKKTFNSDEYVLKYHENAPVVLNPKFVGTPSGIKSRSENYHPFVEEGKCWKYRCTDIGWIGERNPDYGAYYKIEGCTMIDGMEYFNLNEYNDRDGEMTFHATLAYIREDVAAKQIHIVACEALSYLYPESDTILYDFNEPTNSGVLVDCIYNQEYDDYRFEAFDGSIRNGFAYPDSRLMITEGFGLLPLAKNCNDSYDGFAGDIFGLSPIPAGFGSVIVPYLYEITSGDGTVLYVHEPDRYTSGIQRPSVEGDIRQSGDEIEVSVPSVEIGLVQVVAQDGTVIRQFDVKHDKFTFSIKGYLPGAYIITAAGATIKISVK